ncbi:Alpha/Beta hydrolase protein [Daldinia vernicosa]|uniref:Alpha/Beta hydrolase protein n=1 Tax=Daldinia vernicosa TaxID=114800 RepID=UPI0020087CDF|nr:Alpha/Beta hydrolase protein [Daldinia vernicosa]KAI0847357.1 Alpha/Beta hydrolase protein [Daldinia vernicosa]
MFKNIRYAAPPVDGSIGHSCVQAAPNGLNLLGTGNQSPIGGVINQFLGGIPLPVFSGGSEDCLFLDVWYVYPIYVPGKALKASSEKLPVVVFVYGGAYVFSSKNSMQPELLFYDGTGLISQSGNNIIFVAMNYRVGAFGFLAGTTMENEGTPNAGLWDQGGKLDPLFSKAILLSPAFEYMWNRAGAVQKTFEAFARMTGCASQGLMKQQYSGTFAVGPTPDGSYIRQLPVLELSTDNFWNIESLILSRTTAESNVFVKGLGQTDSGFTSFVDAIFPNYTQAARITDKIGSFYAVSGQSKYKSQTDRVQALLRDSSFICNIRHLTDSFGDSKVWNMRYGVSPGAKLGGKSWLENLAALITPGIGSLISGISVALQSYFTNYILTGDPNTNRKIFNLPPAIRWNHPDSQAEQISGVVSLGGWGFSTIRYTQDEKTACDFWRDIAAAVISLGGYSPPGAVVQQSMVDVRDPSMKDNGGNR